MATKKRTTAAAGETKLYDVISPLSYDHDDYAVGDQVELTDEQAAPLLGHTVRPTDAAKKAE